MKLEDKIKFVEGIVNDAVYRRIDVKPFDATVDIIGTTYELIKNVEYDISDEFGEAKDALMKTQKVHRWVNRAIIYESPLDTNIDVNVEKFSYRAKSASETFAERKGLCTDISFLLTTMLRISGVESGIAIASINGRGYNHMCSWVQWLNKKHLVDGTMKEGIGVCFDDVRLFEDPDTRHFFDNYSRHLNSKNWEAWKDYCNNYMDKLGVRYMNRQGFFDRVAALIS